MYFTNIKSNKTMPKMVIGMMIADMFLKGMLFGMYIQKRL